MRTILVAFVFTVSVALLFLYISSFPFVLDPDRFYHYALLREWAAQGGWIMRSWRQFPLLGWNDYFADKEFLFHLLLRIARFLGTEKAVLPVTMVFSASIVCLPYLTFRENRFFALLLSSALLLAQPYTLFRFSLLRPHTLAVLLFTLFVWLFLLRRFRAAAITVFFFTLAYHAFYLPLVFCLLALLVERGLQYFGLLASAGGERWQKALFLSGMAVVVGLVVNPYFPGNIVQAIQHFSIALRLESLESSIHAKFGAELLPMSTAVFLRTCAAPIFLLAAAFARMMYVGGQKREFPREAALLGALSFVFLIACLSSPRMLEFALPLWTIFFLFIFRGASRKVQAGIVLAVLLIQAGGLWNFSRKLRNTGYADAPSAALIYSLLEPVRKAGPGARVFHDNWGLGPYVAYFAPEAEALDALDPTFLFFANPSLALERNAIVEGLIANPVQLLKKNFGARFVLCEPSSLQRQLLAMKEVKVAARSEDGRFVLFEL